MGVFQTIEDACEQFKRYGGFADVRLMEVLDDLVELNDDMHHGRAEDLIHNRIDIMQERLSAVRHDYKQI